MRQRAKWNAEACWWNAAFHRQDAGGMPRASVSLRRFADLAWRNSISLLRVRFHVSVGFTHYFGSLFLQWPARSCGILEGTLARARYEQKNPYAPRDGPYSPSTSSRVPLSPTVRARPAPTASRFCTLDGVTNLRAYFTNYMGKDLVHIREFWWKKSMGKLRFPCCRSRQMSSGGKRRKASTFRRRKESEGVITNSISGQV